MLQVEQTQFSSGFVKGKLPLFEHLKDNGEGLTGLSQPYDTASKSVKRKIESKCPVLSKMFDELQRFDVTDFMQTSSVLKLYDSLSDLSEFGIHIDGLYSKPFKKVKLDKTEPKMPVTLKDKKSSKSHSLPPVLPSVSVNKKSSSKVVSKKVSSSTKPSLPTKGSKKGVSGQQVPTKQDKSNNVAKASSALKIERASEFTVEKIMELYKHVRSVKMARAICKAKNEARDYLKRHPVIPTEKSHKRISPLKPTKPINTLNKGTDPPKTVLPQKSLNSVNNIKPEVKRAVDLSQNKPVEQQPGKVRSESFFKHQVGINGVQENLNKEVAAENGHRLPNNGSRQYSFDTIPSPEKQLLHQLQLQYAQGLPNHIQQHTFKSLPNQTTFINGSLPGINTLHGLSSSQINHLNNLTTLARQQQQTVNSSLANVNMTIPYQLPVAVNSTGFSTIPPKLAQLLQQNLLKAANSNYAPSQTHNNQ